MITLCRIGFGHACLGSYLFRIGKRSILNSSLCSIDELETLQNLILYYNVYQSKRTQIFINLWKSIFHPSIKLQEIYR